MTSDDHDIAFGVVEVGVCWAVDIAPAQGLVDAKLRLAAADELTQPSLGVTWPAAWFRLLGSRLR